MCHGGSLGEKRDLFGAHSHAASLVHYLGVRCGNPTIQLGQTPTLRWPCVSSRAPIWSTGPECWRHSMRANARRALNGTSERGWSVDAKLRMRLLGNSGRLSGTSIHISCLQGALINSGNHPLSDPVCSVNPQRLVRNYETSPPSWFGLLIVN